MNFNTFHTVNNMSRHDYLFVWHCTQSTFIAAQRGNKHVLVNPHQCSTFLLQRLTHGVGCPTSPVSCCSNKEIAAEKYPVLTNPFHVFTGTHTAGLAYKMPYFGTAAVHCAKECLKVMLSWTYRDLRAACCFVPTYSKQP